jgi:hypothetical protein
MRVHAFRLVLLSVVLCAVSASASSYSELGIQLSVPEGFEGPVKGEHDGAHVAAFTKPYSHGGGGTLLQVTVFDFGDALAGMPEEARQSTTDHYLVQLLGGVERRRNKFASTPPSSTTLGGLKASRVEWSGLAEGRDATGVMYAVLLGSKLVSFHTQDLAGAPPENRKAAVAAIEAVVLGDGG